MKTKRTCLLTLLTLCTLHSAFTTARAQGTAFTYQGQLSASNSPASGNYDFNFALFNNSSTNTGQVGGTLTNLDVGVTNGLFIVTLDFGAGIFTGSNYWLEISVRTNGGSSFTALSPLQELTPVPYAVFAGSASNLSGTLPSADLSGTYASAVTLNNAGNSFTGNGTGLINVNAATVDGLSAGQFWNLTGNAGTTPGVNFVGAKDNEPLQLWANGSRAMLLDGTSSSGQPNIIGGSIQNFVTFPIYGATVGGGFSNGISTGNYSTIAGGISNIIQGGPNQPCTIGGGRQNVIQDSADGTTIAGGYQNTVPNGAAYSTIGGGISNTIQAIGSSSTIAGGQLNDIQGTSGPSESCTIGGGLINTILSATSSTIGGGSVNYITEANYSTIGGGYTNIINYAAYSTIAGGFSNNIQNNDNQPSTIGGGQQNTIQSGALGATIAGGYLNTIQIGTSYSTIGGGVSNIIQTNASYSIIGGGEQNTIAYQAADSTIAGGQQNIIQSYAQGSTISGGEQNTITSPSLLSTIGGGYTNTIENVNYATIAGGYLNTIQTSENQPPTIGGGQQNTIQSQAQGSTIAGGYLNTVQSGAYYAAIAGGFSNTIQIDVAYSTIAGGQQNAIQSVEGNSVGNCAIGGGYTNTIQGANYSTIPGGYQNTIQAADYSTIGGGKTNAILNAAYSTIAGGDQNTIQSNPNQPSTIGGGQQNTIEQNAYGCTIAGGFSNIVQGFSYSTIAGGISNVAAGNYTFAAGQQAQAMHSGAFVWADSQPGPFASTAANQFNVRANGGIRFMTSGAGMTLDGNTVLTNNETGLTLTGTFNGNGSSLTSLNASQLTSIGNTNGVNAFANFFVGPAGNSTTSGDDNTAIGTGTLADNTSGSGNTAIGANTLQINKSGRDNTACGIGALGILGENNAAGGSNNIALGFNAGNNYTANESSNIVIGNVGSPGENNIIRIGSNQVAAYIAGVINGSGLNITTTAGTLAVVADQNAVPGITATGGLVSGHMRLRNAVEVWPDNAQANAGYLDVRNTANNATISLTGSSGAIVCSNVTANGVVLTSDRNAKQNFTPLDPEAALAKVSAMPVTEWNYKSDPAGTKHIGPMAQDFHAAFGLNGGDDTHISVVDEGGVALAAIQGLNQKLNEKDAEIEKLKKQLNDLAATVKLLAERK